MDVRKLRFLVIFSIGLILGLISILVLVGASSSVHADTAKPEGPVPVFGHAVKSAELYELLSFPARVQPKRYTALLAETDGIVGTIRIPLGQPVKRGDVLLVLSHTDPVYQYAPMRVRAPIAGIVSSMEVTEGTQVTKDQKLASVTDPGQIRVVIEVPAADLGNLRSGLEGEFRVSGAREPVARLKIRGLSPFVDPASGTATCEMEPVHGAKGARPLLTLAPGLIGRVSLKTRRRRGIAVPDFAILYKEQSTFVRTIVAGKSHQVAVTLGRIQEGQIEVLSGLKDGDVVIDRTSRHVAEGDPVALQAAGAGG